MYQDNLKVEDKLKNVEFHWKDKRVLDMGCNIGMLGVYVFERGAKDYLGVDRGKEYIQEGKKRNPQLKLEEGDLRDYLDYDCDVLVLLSILHHLNDKDIDELLKRTVAKEVICEIPTGKYKYIENDFGDRVKLRVIRSKEWYVERFEKYGFKVENIVDSIAHGLNFRRITLVCRK